MDISLIVPVHNGVGLIEHLIESLNQQKNKLKINREVIFGLDRCDDNSKEVIINNLKNWQYKIIECNNGSGGLTRNDCLNVAEGKYIMFADQDDWFIEKDVTDVLYKTINDNDYDIVEFKIKSHIQEIGEYGAAAVWRAIFSKRIIGDTRFWEGYGEDNQFSELIWRKCGFTNGGWGGMPKYKDNPQWYRINYTPYFYNYPRKGSLMDLKYHTWDKYQESKNNEF